jgi:hypothetical protein
MDSKVTFLVWNSLVICKLPALDEPEERVRAAEQHLGGLRLKAQPGHQLS